MGLVVVGWDERTRVSRLGRKGRWNPLGGRRKMRGLPYGFSPEGCEEMEEGLVWFLDESLTKLQEDEKA